MQNSKKLSREEGTWLESRLKEHFRLFDLTKMAMTTGHAKASIVIGVLEGIIGIALIVMSVVAAGYGNGISAAQSPWWLGALVSE